MRPGSRIGIPVIDALAVPGPEEVLFDDAAAVMVKTALLTS